MLTIAILAKNEEKRIEKCLSHCTFASEILLIDNGSTDKTSSLAKNYNAHVISDLSDDFSHLRNYALEKAKNEWVLFVDCDEFISSQLQQEISKVLKSKRASYTAAFAIKRRDFFWGKELKYGEILRVRQLGLLRLVKKGTGTWIGHVHETYQTRKPTGILASFLDHYPHQTIKEFLMAIDNYSTIRSEELFKKHTSIHWYHIIFWPVGKFVFTYIIRLGFLDGAAGFVYSFMMSFHSFLVRAKLYVKNES
ncbi:MAG: glycosyltransferase family 2 protein [Candidatus Roizmanbacteria bacterium]